jgi:hypothetical protein
VADQKLGPRPYFAAFDFPISTDTLGLSLPGVGSVSAAQIPGVGHHDWQGMSGQADEIEAFLQGGHEYPRAVVDVLAWENLMRGCASNLAENKSGEHDERDSVCDSATTRPVHLLDLSAPDATPFW